MEDVPTEGACTGASPAIAWALVWCGVTIAAPIVLLHSAGGDDSGGVQAAAAYSLLGLGLAYVLVPLSARTLAKVVCCAPPEPPGRGEPFVPGTVGTRARVRRLKVIVNPAGGRRRGLALLESARAVWEREFGIEVLVLETQHAGHARQLARETELEGVDALCVIGGDGSWHEVCNGYAERAEADAASGGASPPTPLGLIPGGSGNSVARDLGMLGNSDATSAAACCSSERPSGAT